MDRMMSSGTAGLIIMEKGNKENLKKRDLWLGGKKKSSAWEELT